MPVSRTILLPALVLLFAAGIATAQDENYVLRLEPATGLIHVEASLAALPDGPLILALPTWGPGQMSPSRSGRAVRNLKVRDLDTNKSLDHERLSPQQWLVKRGRARRVGLEYQVMAGGARFRRGPRKGEGLRHSWVEPGRFLIGVGGLRDRPIRFSCELPEGWSAAANHPRVSTDQFQVLNRRELEGAPLLLGEITWHRFEIGGTDVEIAAVLDPEAAVQPDWEEAERTLRGMFRLHHRVFAPRPRGRYQIQLIFGPREDAQRGYNNTAVVGTRARNLENFAGVFLRMNSAFLRSWFGGVMRTCRQDEQDRGPYDPRGRFFDEGFIDYYDKIFKIRAGFFSAGNLKQILEADVRRELAISGRRNQTLLDAGFSRDQDKINPRRMGFMFALTLDLEIRHATEGRSSLDDVMRGLQRRGGPDRIIDPETLEETVREETGHDPALFFKRHLEGSVFPPLERTLGYVGFDFKVHRVSPRLPFSLRLRADGAEVSYVDRKRVGSLDVRAEDFVVAIDGREDYDLVRDFGKKKPGQKVKLNLVRKGEEHQVEVALIEGTRFIPLLRMAEDPPAEAGALRRGWLGR